MDPVTIGSVCVAVVAGISAWFSQRAASRASTANTMTTTQAGLEKDRRQREDEAYERARAFDVATIAHQDSEITDLRLDRIELRAEIRTLRARIKRLEALIPPELLPNDEENYNAQLPNTDPE